VKCDKIVQQPAPSRPIARGIAGPALLAHVLMSKYGDHRVLRTQPLLSWWKRCFTKDEGRPLGVGLQEQAPNHHKLRELRVLVVSVAGNGGTRSRQVRLKETNASEPLMTCRKVPDDVETGREWLARDKVGGYLFTAQSASGMKAA
jgi:hypothetical protein